MLNLPRVVKVKISDAHAAVRFCLPVHKFYWLHTYTEKIMLLLVASLSLQELIPLAAANVE